MESGHLHKLVRLVVLFTKIKVNLFEEKKAGVKSQMPIDQILKFSVLFRIFLSRLTFEIAKTCGNYSTAGLICFLIDSSRVYYIPRLAAS